MSIQEALAFIEKMKEDHKLREAIDGSVSMEQKQKLAAEAGFNFTAEELKQAFEAICEDEDIEQAAGGGCGDMSCGDYGCDHYCGSHNNCPGEFADVATP